MVFAVGDAVAHSAGNSATLPAGMTPFGTIVPCARSIEACRWSPQVRSQPHTCKV